MTISWIVLSVLYVLLGISLAIWLSFVMSVIGYIFGVILILYDGLVIYGFYRSKEQKVGSLLTLFLGIVSAALGVVMVMYPSMVQGVIFAVLGLYIAIDAVLNIRHVLVMRRLDDPKWKIHLFLFDNCSNPGHFHHMLPVAGGGYYFQEY